MGNFLSVFDVRTEACFKIPHMQLCVHGSSVAQSCPALCNPIRGCSPPGSSAHGISQARIPEWAATSFSRGIFPTHGSNLHLQCLLLWQANSLPLNHQGSPLTISVCAQSLSCVQLFVTPWTVACQPPLSMEFSSQEYWSGLHFLLQGIFPT